MKAAFRVFLILCFVFLAWALYRADYLCVPRIISPVEFVASFVFLFAGFLGAAISWKGMVGASGFDASIGRCIAGTGLSTFGKYVPGKVWAIAGRAAYLARGNRSLLPQLSLVSLTTQFVDLWTALALGIAGLCALGGLQAWGSCSAASWFCLTILAFSPALQRATSAAGRYVLGREVGLPSANLRATILVLPWFVLTWGLWSIAFYLLARSVCASDIPWMTAFGFPFAVAWGIVALVAPGGLGVREGVLTAYLVLAGLPLTEATTVAVTSRLWWLIGECFMFVVGLAAHRLECRAVVS